MADFSLKIYGCRGTIPVSGTPHLRYGGDTSCVVIHIGKRTIVFDAGSGIRKWGMDMKEKDPKVYLFVSHLHFDHVVGLPYFVPLYRPDATIHMWGPSDPRGGDFHSSIATLLAPPFHPVSLSEMQSEKNFYDIGEESIVYFLKGRDEPLQVRHSHPKDRDLKPDPNDVEFTVECLRGYNHPKSGVNIYKVNYKGKSLVYATDTEGFVSGDRRLIEFAKDADILIHDAMYTEEKYLSATSPTQGYGHSTFNIACKVAKDANVKKLVLWHHDPLSNDDDLDEIFVNAKQHFPNTVMGQDGLDISI